MINPLKTVVIADDDPAICRLLHSALEQMGYQCVGVAANTAEAQSLVSRLKPNLALVDVHMPATEGLELTHHVASLRTTAVVVMTADRDPALGRQAMALGASGYMQKPFDQSQLAAVLESAWHSFQTVILLQDKAKALDDALELRKVTEKAKGILMEQQGMTEDEAHRTLLKLSQDQGLTLKDVCRSIIQVRMVLGKKSKKVA